MKYALLTLTALLFIACTPTTPTVPVAKEQNLSLENNASKLLEAKILADKKEKALKKQKAKAKRFAPPPPKKKIKLKKVKDNNFDANYMYPKAKKKKEVKELVKENKPKIVTDMTREECITMISQIKFDKYTAMFGNEEASIKRCAMLKAMRK